MTVSAIIAEADSISASASKIRSHILDIQKELDAIKPPVVTPPVIVIRRGLTTITPDDVPGATTQEKVENAHQEAIERNRPMRWHRALPCQNIRLSEAHDGLVIEFDPLSGPVLPDVPNVDRPEWGWLYYIAPAAGKSATITMRSPFLDGNRKKAARQYSHKTGHTQHGLVLGNTGLGRARVIVEGGMFSDFDGAGSIVMGDDCELVAIGAESTRNGYGGFETTRGRQHLIRCHSHHNDGLGANPSSGEFTLLQDTVLEYNGGGGFKVSERLDKTLNASRVHLSNAVIRHNRGLGMASTSASPGTRITGGLVTFESNEVGSMNLTNGHCDVSLDRVVCRGNGEKIGDDTTDILLHGGTCHLRVGELEVSGSKWRGISGGWGSRLEVGRLRVTDCAGPGIRWVGAADTLIVDELTSAANGGPDEIREQ